MKKHVIRLSVLWWAAVWTVGCAPAPQESGQEARPYAAGPVRDEHRLPPATTGASEALPEQHLLDVPLIRQNPELKNGCEVTSLAMLLRYAGYDVDKVTLARQVKKDTEPLVERGGDIKRWGDPNRGFVGDMTGRRKGFAVYNRPLEELLRRYVGDRAVNLTGQPFEAVLKSVARGRPVVIWATGDFAPPTEWESWHKDGKKIVAPLDEHAVLVVGYDADHVYVNDPLSGVKQQRVSRAALKKSWEALGRQAITYR